VVENLTHAVRKDFFFNIWLRGIMIDPLRHERCIISVTLAVKKDVNDVNPCGLYLLNVILVKVYSDSVLKVEVVAADMAQRGIKHR
jgi:hypothetical protein